MTTDVTQAVYAFKTLPLAWPVRETSTLVTAITQLLDQTLQIFVLSVCLNSPSPCATVNPRSFQLPGSCNRMLVMVML